MKNALIIGSALALITVSGNAAANDRRDSRIDRIAQVAHQLQDAAYATHGVAHTSHVDSRRQRRAVKKLHKLHQRAEQFAHAVNYGGDWRSLRKPYRKLLAAFDKADRDMRYLHGCNPRIAREFHTAQRLMRKLIYLFEQDDYDDHGDYASCSRTRRDRVSTRYRTHRPRGHISVSWGRRW